MLRAFTDNLFDFVRLLKGAVGILSSLVVLLRGLPLAGAYQCARHEKKTRDDDGVVGFLGREHEHGVPLSLGKEVSVDVMPDETPREFSLQFGCVIALCL